MSDNPPCRLRDSSFQQVLNIKSVCCQLHVHSSAVLGSSALLKTDSTCVRNKPRKQSKRWTTETCPKAPNPQNADCILQFEPNGCVHNGHLSVPTALNMKEADDHCGR